MSEKNWRFVEMFYRFIAFGSLYLVFTNQGTGWALFWLVCTAINWTAANDFGSKA